MADLLYNDPQTQVLDATYKANTQTLYKPLTTDNAKVTHVTGVSNTTGASTVVITGIEQTEGTVYRNDSPALSYTRYLVSELFPFPIQVYGSPGETYGTILERISSSYFIPPFITSKSATAYDVTDAFYNTALPDSAWSKQTIDVVFDATSPGYVGTLSVIVVNKEMGELLIPIRTLTGLAYPNAPGTKKNLTVLVSPISMPDDRSIVSTLGRVLSPTSDEEFISDYVDNIVKYYARAITTEAATELRKEMTALLGNAQITNTTIPSSGDLPWNPIVEITPSYTSSVYEGIFSSETLSS